MIGAIALRLGLPAWLLELGAISALVASAWSWIAWKEHAAFERGIAQESTQRDQLEQANSARADTKLAVLNGELATAQKELDLAVARLDLLASDLNHEKDTTLALQSDLADGRRRLSVLTRARPIDSAGPAPGASAGQLDPGAGVVADLDPTVASGVVGLTGTGDGAIIRLNACIAQYDAVKAAADAVK